MLTARAAAAGAFDSLFLGLGVVALIVGAVGVANIMIISVLERRSEIGLRRALGATQAQIRTQFLGESILLAVIGGVVGVLAGAAATAVYADAKGWDIVIPAEAWAGGIAAAWYLYLRRPELPDRIASRFSRLYRLLSNKYYIDWFYENVVATAVRNVGASLWRRGDETVIDGWLVNGSARAVAALAAIGRQLQSGYLYHYAFAMIIGLSLLLGWLLWRS